MYSNRVSINVYLPHRYNTVTDEIILTRGCTVDKSLAFSRCLAGPTPVVAMKRHTFPVKFNGVSYDLKNFLRDHPGGVNTLRPYEGKSIKYAMQKFGHSTSAYHMLKDLKVGDDNLTGELSGSGRIITNEDSDRDLEDIAFLEEMENRLDWSMPILSQLHRIAPHYNKWVNTAVYRECRLFASPVAEALTYTPWYLVPMFWVPIIVYLVVTQYADTIDCGESCKEAPLSHIQFLFHMSLGVLVWTMLEYSLHRWVFHLDPGQSIALIKFHFIMHGMHHKVPFDSYRQVFPPIPAFGIACVLYAVMVRPFMSYPVVKLAGGLIGYLTYDMIHFYVHHGSPKNGTYLYAMKRYHSNHHFVNNDRAFGISNKLWDHVFRTVVSLKNLNLSLNWNFE